MSVRIIVESSRFLKKKIRFKISEIYEKKKIQNLSF